MQFLVLLLLWLLGTIIATAVATLAAGLGVAINAPGNMLWIQALNQILSFALPVIAVYLLYYRNDKNFFGLRFGSCYWILALAAVAVMLLAQPFVDWCSTWNDSMHLPGSFGETLEHALRSISAQSEPILESMLCRAGVGNLALNLLVLALLPALCEELFFRVAMQRFFIDRLHNVHVAILLTAAIFSLAHCDPFAFLPRFLLGVLLGYTFVYSGSLLVNVLAHFANNAVIVLLYFLYSNGHSSFYPDSSLAVPAIYTAAATLAALVVFYFAFVRKRIKKNV